MRLIFRNVEAKVPRHAQSDFQHVAIHHSHPRRYKEIALENAALRQQLTIRVPSCGIAIDYSGQPDEDLETMENGARRRATRYCCELAAAAIQAVLEEAVPEEGTRTSEGLCRSPEAGQTMAAANVTWGAPGIHGELLKLGFEMSERTVSRLMPTPRKNPSQTWKTFLTNHVGQLVSPTEKNRARPGKTAP